MCLLYLGFFHFRGRKSKNSDAQTSKVIDLDDLVSDNESIDRLTIPAYGSLASQTSSSPLTYRAQTSPGIYMSPMSNNFYQYPAQKMLCLRRVRSIFGYESHAKCTGCVKICCFTCSQVYYNSSNGYFKCEQCSLDFCPTATKWF